MIAQEEPLSHSVCANKMRLPCRVHRGLPGFGWETYEAVRRLSAKWCAEPSVHGGSGGRGGGDGGIMVDWKSDTTNPPKEFL